MKALVYHGPNRKSWDEVPDPTLIDPTDAIASVDATTICGSDLHILKGDLPEVTPGGPSAMRPFGSRFRAGSSRAWSQWRPVDPQISKRIHALEQISHGQLI